MTFDFASIQPRVGYCMNVHPASDLASVENNLKASANEVRKALMRQNLLTKDEKLGVGLWLSQSVIEELFSSLQSTTLDQAKFGRLRQTIDDCQLDPFTFNGFPQHNFHQPIVKHAVYQPTWFDRTRVDYTLRLAQVLCELLPPNQTGSISTLPISWGEPKLTAEQRELVVSNLNYMAQSLHQLYEKTGRTILLAIEPEPGCQFGDCASLRNFFVRHLFKGKHVDVLRRYITVCHDVCHAAVMREDQCLQIQAYRDCGIRIGKVQISSAIYVDWDLMKPAEKIAAFDQVKGFAEDRYLHQTTTRNGPVGSVRFVEDLAQLLDGITAAERLVGNWAIHFHVPIQVEAFGQLQTTQTAIPEVLDALRQLPSLPISNGMRTQPVQYARPMRQFEADPDAFFTGHFEIETYAWSVLPARFRRENLVADIVQEFAYLLPQLQS